MNQTLNRLPLDVIMDYLIDYNNSYFLPFQGKEKFPILIYVFTNPREEIVVNLNTTFWYSNNLTSNGFNPSSLIQHLITTRNDNSDFTRVALTKKLKNLNSLITTRTGIRLYFRDGELHRAEGPAIIESNGHTEYWFNGNPHRENGPAIYSSQGRFYYLYGKEMSVEQINTIIQKKQLNKDLLPSKKNLNTRVKV